MFNPLTVIAVFVIYMAFLFAAALLVERQSLIKSKSWANHPIVYPLSLAVYCSSWTYYGSVGQVVTSGPLFLAIYLGPTLSMVLWWTVLRKLVRIKSSHRITSIADFISARYNRSQSLAALVTVGALLGSMPYIALQLKSVISTFAIISASDVRSTWATQLIGRHVGPILVLLMSAFTIVFGVRRIDPTERHQGMVMAVAVESLVKLVAFLAAGIFVTYFLYDGFGDIFQRLSESPYHRHLALAGKGSTTYLTWTSLMILAMSAIMFLPRQFHLAVVENSDEKHILPAMWLFPLYLLLINIFVIPIALGGLLAGLGTEQADHFVLLLPMTSGHSILTLLVFIGGFSAATGMVMISAMTIATMTTNHLLLPLVERVRSLEFLKRHVLKCRWVAVVGYLFIGYWFECLVGQSYMLVNIGIISFAAALQFAPAILIGIFWRRANKPGAILGMGAGLALWFYTLLLPSLVKGGWISDNLIRHGLWGIGFFKPEQLFGLTGLDPVSHSIFWSMFFNIGLLVFGSLYFRQTEEEKQLADSFVGALATREKITTTRHNQVTIELSAKKQKIIGLLSRYFSDQESEAIFDRCVAAAGFKDKDWISTIELAQLVSEVEKSLAGAFGAAAAHRITRQGKIYTPAETDTLTEVYREILARMHLTPEQVKQKIDYYQEREELLIQHARELEEKVTQRDQEIAERKRAEEALRKAEEKYRAIFENAVEGIFQSTPEGHILSANPAYARIFGYDSPEDFINDIKDIGQQIYVDPGQRTKLLNLIREKSEVTGFEVQCYRRDKDIIWISINARAVRDTGGKLLYVEGLAENITERKRAEEERTKLEDQLRQAQKMEALGTLAGGIAHDFNNLLTGILGNTSLMLLDVDPSHPHYVNLKRIEKQAESGGKLTRQLLGYARKGRYEVQPIDLNRLVEETSDTFGRTRKEIRIHRELAEDLLAIEADQGQVEQVLLNLYVNAADAMPQGGDLSLKTRNTTHANIKDNLHPKPGNYVLLGVADMGMGMDKETMERIFEPFFTTKERGRGTGLGLASVYGIIKGHGGYIDVESRRGQGTAFNIYLPASENKIAKAVRKAEDLVMGSGTVLLVDDEEMILEVSQKLLEAMGYRVLAAQSGREAIELYKEKRDDLDLVILDIIMPDMGGGETFDRMREINPDIEVLLSSGYSVDRQASRILERGCKGFIQKPFDMSELSRKIREILEK